MWYKGGNVIAVINGGKFSFHRGSGKKNPHHCDYKIRWFQRKIAITSESIEWE